MLEGELAKIYTKLWKLSDDVEPPVWVLYNNFHFEVGERGKFMTHLADDDGVVTDPDHVRIWIWRMPAPDPSDEPDLAGADLQELITLAHERGHEMSWRSGTYKPTSMPEERRAWAFAEQLLGDLGFVEWTAFEEAKRAGLGEHFRRGTPEH